MTYIQNSLLNNEKIVYMTRMHWIVFAMPVVLLLVALALTVIGKRLFPLNLPYLPWSLSAMMIIICLGAAIIAGIDAFIRYQTSEYGITNKRVLIKTGWIRRNSLELFLDKVEAIYVDQSIPGRILNYGTIRVVGTGGTQDPFFYIPAPLTLRKVAQQQIDLEGHPAAQKK